MPKGFRWLGLGVSLGASLSLAIGARRWLAAPRAVAPLRLEPGSPIEPDTDVERAAHIEAVGADTLDGGTVGPPLDRRSGGERRVEARDDLAARIKRATNRRFRADRRSGAERHLPDPAPGLAERTAAAA
jgi:hypothetical protein